MLLVALWAAVAMALQDIFGTLMVQAEARNRGWLAGTFDSAGWLCGILTTTLSVTALQGHDLALKVAVITAVTIANFVGSLLGVAIGKKLIKESP